VGRGSAAAPARPHTRGRHLQAVGARAARPAEAAAPEPPGGRERCPRAGRAGVGRRAQGLEGRHAPGRDPRNGARAAPGRQRRARHRRSRAIRAARRVERTEPPGRPDARQPRFPCPANPPRPPGRQQSPPGPSAPTRPRSHRPAHRRTSSPVETTRTPVPARQKAKADRLKAEGRGRRRIGDREKTEVESRRAQVHPPAVGATRRWARGRQAVRTGPRRGADRWPAEGQVTPRPREPGRWGSSPAMPGPRLEPPAPLPRRQARRPGTTHPLPPATRRPRPPGRARVRPREPGRDHRSDPRPGRPLHPTPVPGADQAPPQGDLGWAGTAPRMGAGPPRRQGEGPAASPPPDPRPAAPTRGARRVLGDLARDARAGGRGRSFGPRKLPRAAPGRASGPAYRGWRASATALVHNPRRPHTAGSLRGLGWKRPDRSPPASKESPWPSRPTPSPRTSPS
jgi:hypothetical protein